jgi:hypothetical protein
MNEASPNGDARMRMTQSFLLRLLIDPDCPAVLRGTLHVVADSQEFAFADEPALLDLLHQVTVRRAVPPDESPCPPSVKTTSTGESNEP